MRGNTRKAYLHDELNELHCGHKPFVKTEKRQTKCKGCRYSYTLDVSHEKRSGCRPPVLGNGSFFTQLTCGGIPPGLLLGHLPEGGQPQWGCQVLCSGMKPQGMSARNCWPRPQQSIYRPCTHTFFFSYILMITLTRPSALRLDCSLILL